VADETDQTPVVTRNENSSRYEIRFGGRVAGFAAFRESAGRVAFTHTVVDPEFEGHGLGSTLVRSALTDTADRGETIVPFCPFVQDWLKRHTEFDGAVDWAPVTT
jgi:predicted GNAT family acetyltransferase